MPNGILQTSMTTKSCTSGFCRRYVAFIRKDNDTVTVSRLTATNQSFGVATYYSERLEYPDFKPDGILGMAWQSISAYNAVPVFENSSLIIKQIHPSL
jgi:hypothetical protein